MKHAVMALIFNKEGKVLSVSRKHNFEDKGLPGGKMDNDDPDLEYALKREVKEETGLDIVTSNMDLVFAMFKDGFMGHTFLIKDWSGEIEFDEPHEVKWVNFEEVMNGSFGKWNKMVCESLINMGIEFDLSEI